MRPNALSENELSQVQQALQPHLLETELFQLILQNDPSLLMDITKMVSPLPEEAKNTPEKLFEEILKNFPQILFYLHEDSSLNKNDPINLNKAKLSKLAHKFFNPEPDTFMLIPITQSIPPSLSEKDYCVVGPLQVAIQKIKTNPGIFINESNNLTQQLEILSQVLKEEAEKDPSKIKSAQQIAMAHFEMIKDIFKVETNTEFKRKARETCLEKCSRISTGKVVLRTVARIAEIVFRLFTPAPLPKIVREKMELDSPLSPAYSKAGFFISPKVDEQAKAINEILRPKFSA